MARYRVGKAQVKRLLEGKFVTDGEGRNYVTTGELKEFLQMIDDRDLYDRLDLFLENGVMDYEMKGEQA